MLKKFSGGSFWLLLSTLAWRVPSALSTIIIARILGPVGFGQFGMINSTISMFQLYAGMRLGETTTKYIAEHRYDNPAKATRILKLTLTTTLALCSVLGATMIFLAPYLAATTLKKPEFAFAYVVGGGLLFFRVYGLVQEFVLLGFCNYKAIAKVNLVKGIATPLFCIPFAMLWGINGLFSALAGISCMAFFLLFKVVRDEKKRAGFDENIGLRDASSEASILWTFALPGVLTGTFVAGSQWMGRIMLTQIESGFAELGLFEAGHQWRVVVLFLPAVMAKAMLPILAESFSKASTNFERAVEIQLRSVCVSTAMLVIMMIGCTDILVMVFGDDFSGAGKVIPILMVSVFFAALNHSLRMAYDGSGHRWTNCIMYFGRAAIFLSLCYVLISKFGSIGLAWSFLGAELMLFFVQASYVNIVLAPGSIKVCRGVLFFASLLIVIQYLVWQNFSTFYSVMIALMLVLLVLVILLYKFNVAGKVVRN